MAAYLTKTLGTPTDNLKWTFSGWIKISGMSGDRGIFALGDNSTDFTRVNMNGNGAIEFDNKVGSTFDGRRMTSAYHRDPAAWYHIVAVFDSANATADDKMILYVNGSRITALGTDIDPSASAASGNTSSKNVRLSVMKTSSYFTGNMAHVHFCDGYAYAASDFGETDSTSGIWIAKTSPSVSYGNNGFFLKFQDTSAFGDDSSGNNNDMTMSGTITQTKDTPDNNFCTINPLSAGAINGAGTPLTNGNTRIADGDTNWRTALGTIGDDQGKYYWEVKIDGSQTNWWLGILDARQVVKGEYKLTAKSRGYGVTSNGDKGNNNSEVSWATATIAQNDIVSIAVDMDNGKIYFGHNGTWLESGDPTSGSTGTGSAYDITTGCCYLPAFTVYDTNSILAANFGNGYFGTTAVSSAGTNASGIGTFEYDVPTGYTAVSTLGLME